MAEEQSDHMASGAPADMTADEGTGLPDAAEIELKEDPSQPLESGSSAFDRLAKRRKKKEAVVDRTKLDVEACVELGAKTKAELEERLRNQLEAQPLEQAKLFASITDFKLAAPCGSKWEAMSGSGRIKFCQQCELQVYDFAKTELPEAREVIFQQEGKENFVLYKRKDGTFLTRNCPVGVKSRQVVILLCVAGVVLVCGLATIVAGQPPPPPPSITEKSPEPERIMSQTELDQPVSIGRSWKTISPKPEETLKEQDFAGSTPAGPEPFLDVQATVPTTTSDVAAPVSNSLSPEQQAPATVPAATSVQTSPTGQAVSQPLPAEQTDSLSEDSIHDTSVRSQPTHQTGIWQRPDQ